MIRIHSVQIFTVQHQNQRYDTVGDWTIIDGAVKDDKILIIRVSDTGNWFFNMLIAVHELVEAILCVRDEITMEAVDDWDRGKGSVLVEPGASIDAPYHTQHMCADAVERALCQMGGAKWPTYEQAINDLPTRKKS